MGQAVGHAPWECRRHPSLPLDAPLLHEPRRQAAVASRPPTRNRRPPRAHPIDHAVPVGVEKTFDPSPPSEVDHQLTHEPLRPPEKPRQASQQSSRFPRLNVEKGRCARAQDDRDPTPTRTRLSSRRCRHSARSSYMGQAVGHAPSECRRHPSLPADDALPHAPRRKREVGTQAPLALDNRSPSTAQHISTRRRRHPARSPYMNHVVKPPLPHVRPRATGGRQERIP